MIYEVWKNSVVLLGLSGCAGDGSCIIFTSGVPTGCGSCSNNNTKYNKWAIVPNENNIEQDEKDWIRRGVKLIIYPKKNDLHNFIQSFIIKIRTINNIRKSAYDF